MQACVPLTPPMIDRLVIYRLDHQATITDERCAQNSKIAKIAKFGKMSKITKLGK